MATKEKTITETSQIEEAMKDSFTTAIKREEKKDNGPRVRIFIPKLEGDGSVAIDQYEHVTISNEVGEPKVTRIHRGEWVDVPVNVYMQLKERYPDL